MERRLRREEVMTIEVLHERGMSNRAIARQLGVHENAVRYRLRRLTSGAVDGRSAKTHSAEPWAEQVLIKSRSPMATIRASGQRDRACATQIAFGVCGIKKTAPMRPESWRSAECRTSPMLLEKRLAAC